jgi:NTP pyrophosphatase (non-canonical NTP hydrolase)
MKWEEYKVLSERTLSSQFYCDDRMQRLLHAVVGMLTEVEEVLDNHSMADADQVNRAEEWGDIAWYMAILAREYSLPLVDTSEGNLEGTDHTMDMTKRLLRLLDMMKKSVYYNKPFDDGVAGKLSSEVISSMLRYASVNGIDTEQAMRANIEKLRARYGDKFSSEAAINRDLDNERRVLTDNL